MCLAVHLDHSPSPVGGLLILSRSAMGMSSLADGSLVVCPPAWAWGHQAEPRVDVGGQAGVCPCLGRKGTVSQRPGLCGVLLL